MKIKIVDHMKKIETIDDLIERIKDSIKTVQNTMDQLNIQYDKNQNQQNERDYFNELGHKTALSICLGWAEELKENMVKENRESHNGSVKPLRSLEEAMDEFGPPINWGNNETDKND